MHWILGIWECGALRRFGSRAGRGAGDCEHPSAPYPPKSSDPKRRGAASSRSSRCASPAEGETPNGVNWNREGRPTEELGASRPGSQHERAGRPSSLDPSPDQRCSSSECLRPRCPGQGAGGVSPPVGSGGVPRWRAGCPELLQTRQRSPPDVFVLERGVKRLISDPSDR